MKPLHHREVGTVGSGFLFDELNCECICDGIHVSGPAIQLLHKNKPADKMTLITDAMRAKHMPDGVSELGGQVVIVKMVKHVWKWYTCWKRIKNEQCR